MFFSKPAKNGGGGGSTPVTSLTGTPTEIVYIDNAGVGTSDALATRDSVTNETYIGYRTSGGDFSNGFHLGNILGGAISDGAGLQRHDAVNDTYTFFATIDGTSIGGRVNTLVGGYVDFTNNIYSTATFDKVSAGFDYDNSVLGVGGSIQLNDTNAYIEYSDNGNTFQAQTQYESNGITTQYRNIGANASTQLFTGDGFISGGDRFNERNSMIFNLDDNSQQFYVKGLKHINPPSISGINFTGSGLNNIIVDFSGYVLTTPTVYNITIDGLNTDFVEFNLSTLVGTFVVGETITSTSGGSATILGISNDSTNNYQYISLTGTTGTFLTGDVITGSISGTTATLFVDLYQMDTYSWNDGGINSGALLPAKILKGTLISQNVILNFSSGLGHVINDNWVFTISPSTTSLGDMLNLNAQFGTMRMGDTTQISSRVFYEVNDTNGYARVHGLQSVVPSWTPSTLSDGFTGSGLNDMHYDSTTTYTGTYPRVYTATISAVDCVRLQIYSITTPGFTVGDTVTDLVSGSTGTILSGGDAEGIIIIQPIIDNGWNTATQVDDITSGASSLCIFNQYTDTFDWNDGGTFVTYKDTNTFVLLNDGLSVGFYNFTGHTIGDSWQFTMLQGTNYTDMAFFDGVNRTMSIGDVEQAAKDVRTDWVLGTGKKHGIYEYLGDAQEYRVSNSVGKLLVLDSDTFNQTVIFSIADPFNGQTPFSVKTDNGAYGFRFQMFDAGQHSATLGAPTVGNNTFLRVDDDTKTITLGARHISAPLSAYADDADAGTNGVVTGELYQTDGTGSAPLNIAGIVMIKQ